MYSKKKADGGPVYPQTMDTQVGGEGLSLRDYFAGLALQGLMADRGRVSTTAKTAYEYADAMLEARRATAAAK